MLTPNMAVLIERSFEKAGALSEALPSFASQPAKRANRPTPEHSVADIHHIGDT
jgi:hypothetical protein